MVEASHESCVEEVPPLFIDTRVPKVGYLEVAIVVDEQILQFKIPVAHALMTPTKQTNKQTHIAQDIR
jgi:hypothetical protein